MVNVEVQSTTEKDFTNRVLAYSGRLYSEQLDRGDEYTKLIPVYSLVFTMGNINEFTEVDDYLHICNIRRVTEPQVVMSRGMCFVIIELNKFTKKMANLANKKDYWCFVLKHSKKLGIEEYQKFLQKGEDMEKAMKHLLSISQDRELREEEQARQKQKHKQLAGMHFAKEEGLMEGMEKGMEKGREEGREEERKKLALSMLEDDFNVEVIIKHTSLLEEEVQTLAKEHGLKLKRPE